MLDSPAWFYCNNKYHKKKVKTNLSNASLASKLEATTDMEKEVEMLLTAGGASEASLAEKEMEELKSKVTGWLMSWLIGGLIGCLFDQFGWTIGLSIY